MLNDGVVGHEIPLAIERKCHVEIFPLVALVHEQPAFQLHLERFFAVFVVGQKIRPMPVVGKLVGMMLIHFHFLLHNEISVFNSHGRIT